MGLSGHGDSLSFVTLHMADDVVMAVPVLLGCC